MKDELGHAQQIKRGGPKALCAAMVVQIDVKIEPSLAVGVNRGLGGSEVRSKQPDRRHDWPWYFRDGVEGP
jgi:hypothetical protein